MRDTLRGTFHALAIIWRDEGYRGWYRGLAPTMLGYLPSWALFFLVYDGLKRNLAILSHRHNYEWVTPASINIMSAMGAGAISTAATNPLWVVKTRFMTQTSATSYHYHSVPNAFASIYKTEGLRGFYKGLGTSLIGVAHPAVHFPLYEKLKSILVKLETKSLPESHENHQLSALSVLAASCTSKMIACVMTYPHEVLRTRLQNQTVEAQYTSLRHCIKTMYTQEGIRSFYRGLGTNLLRTLPNSAITLFTYERVSNYLAVWSGAIEVK